jgi:hypothetical protein
MPQNPTRQPFICDSVIGVGPIKQISTATHHFDLTDVNRYIQFTPASAVTATVDPDSTVDFPISTVLTIEQNGVGAVTFAAGGGVTINSAGGNLAMAAQYGVASLVKVAANTWTLMGNLS